MTFIRFAFLNCLLLFSLLANSQTDSCRLRISLLTCSPGAELYSTFGHTAIRVTDSAHSIDQVYNYGTFDDSDPNFYPKFTKGLMLYFVSNYSFTDFLREYQYEGRGVIEQVLHLSCAEKQQLYAALQQNALDQNKFYYYYFHNDNCTTRARDMIAQRSGAKVIFKNILPAKPPTYRDLIHSYLDKGGQYWSKFGIDLLLGANLDRRVTNEQAMFLPDYLMMGFDNAVVGDDHQPLVSQKLDVLPVAVTFDTSGWFTPILLCTLLLLFAGVLSFVNATWSRRVLNVFDRVFFAILGLLGIVMLILWIIRVDDVCRNNLNILWALPTHFFVAAVLQKKWSWIQVYFRVILVLALVILAWWPFMPQQLNNAILPLLGIIIVRSLVHSRLVRDKIPVNANAGKKYSNQ